MQDWILYQIRSAEPNTFRFVITKGFQDETVEGRLKEGEFIDSTSTLLGELGGDVTVLFQPHASLLDALLGVARWQMPDGPCWCENHRRREGLRKHHFKPCAAARAAIANAEREE